MSIQCCLQHYCLMMAKASFFTSSNPNYIMSHHFLNICFLLENCLFSLVHFQSLFTLKKASYLLVLMSLSSLIATDYFEPFLAFTVTHLLPLIPVTQPLPYTLTLSTYLYPACNSYSFVLPSVLPLNT